MTLRVRFQASPRLRIFCWALVISLFCGAVELGEPLDDIVRAGRNWVRAQPSSGEIIVVAIDDRTVERYGSIDRSRAVDAKLVDKLFALGARRVFFDRIYADRGPVGGDRIFGDTLRKYRGRVFLAAANPRMNSQRSMETLPIPELREGIEFRALNGYATAFQFGFFLSYGDPFLGRFVPSIAASLADLPPEDRGVFRPDFSIRMSTVPTIGALSVLDDKVVPGALTGRDVMLGYTSQASGNIHYMLGQGQVAGTYLHVVGAETLKRGLPFEGGWLPPFAVGALASLGLLHARRRYVRMIVLAVPIIFGVLPLWLDAQLIEVDLFPGLLIYGLVAWRWRAYGRLEATRRIQPTSDLPNLVALEESELAAGGTLIAAKLRNFSEIAASFPTRIERELFQELARRIRVSGDVDEVYHGEDALLWLSRQPMGPELANHLTGLHKLSSQSVRIGDRDVDLLLAFGVDADASRPLSSRVASAMLSAEEAARANDVWKFYDPERLHHAAWQLSLMGRLTHAVDSGEIWVAYQPKVDLASGRIVGVEALARWTHPTAGPIGPDQFIAAAEAHNRIGELTGFVLARALADLAALREAGHKIGMAVNLSPQLLTDRTLVPRIGTLLARHDIPHDRLTLEVTETGELLSSPGRVATMERLAATGVQISIDDYGTGNATLEYLSRLPSQEVKIDRTFITDLDSNTQNLILVRSTLEMAHRLGRRVVAEGVENEATIKVLKELGCDIVQGYLLGRPLPLEQLMTLLDADRARPRMRIVIS